MTARCKNGHELTPDNTYQQVDKAGVARRRCRICKLAYRKRQHKTILFARTSNIRHARYYEHDLKLAVRPKVLMDAVLQNGARYRRYECATQV